MRFRTLKSVVMFAIFALLSCSLFATDKKSDSAKVNGDVRISVDLDFGIIRIGTRIPPKKAPPPPPRRCPPPPHKNSLPPPPPPRRCPPPPPRRVRHYRSVRRVVIDPTKPLPPSTHFYPDFYGDTDATTDTETIK